MRRFDFSRRGRRGAEPRFQLGRAPQPPQPVMPDLPWRTIGRITGGITAAVLVIAAGVWLWQSDLTRVQSVQVHGTQVVDAQEVIAVAALEGESMFTLDAGPAVSRIAELPGVRDVAIRRDWPRGVAIEVTEQQGWGYWQAGGLRSVIDAEGQVLYKARPPAETAPTIYETNGTPLQFGAYADRDTVRLVARLLSDGTFMRLRAQPERFEFDRARGLTVHIKDGPSAVFGGSQDYEFKVAAWAALLEQIRTEQLTAGEVDLRFGRELVVR